MAEVRLNHIRKSYGATEVVPDLSLNVPDRSFTCLVGPSGCGKSTVLRMIAGLEEVSGGTIEIGGRDVTHSEPADRGIAMVFQSYALYPHMTVRENIGFGLKMANMSKAEIRDKVEDAARTLQLQDQLDRRPAALSGGQRQRVAIGRSIVRDPDVFLFDEPLSNLDASLRTQMRVELAELHEKLDATMIYVTHDQVEAMTMADQIVILKSGSIEQVGAPMELYNAPANPFVAGFIGTPKMNLITGKAAAARGAHTIGIRPEHLELNDDGQGWQATVRHSEHLGSDTFAYLDADDIGLVTMRIHGDMKLDRGSKIYISPQEEYLHKFS